MKITHVCLCGPVTDNWAYQDNLLPKYHKKNGYDVSVITSKYIWNDKGKLDIDHRAVYYNEYGIKTIRIESKFNSTVQSKFKKYKNLYQTIKEEKPDILFIHGCQFLDIKYVVTYLKKNPNVKVYVDNHADFSNSARNWFSKKVLHQLIWKKRAHMIEPYTTKFYGVLPSRVDFLIDVYDLPKEKVELLVMGADDENIAKVKSGDARRKIREKYNIKENDFLVITGGKIDSAKRQTLLLMEAVNQMTNNEKLIVFGSVDEALLADFNRLCNFDKVQYVGWLSSEDTYQYFEAADLAVFPGRHSVLWEQAAGQGLPILVKYWKGTTHIDLGGNVKFLYKDSSEEIKLRILELVNNREEYSRMKKVSQSDSMKKFSYEEIARKSIM